MQAQFQVLKTKLFLKINNHLIDTTNRVAVVKDNTRIRVLTQEVENLRNKDENNLNTSHIMNSVLAEI